MTLYVDISTGNLLSGLNLATPIQAASLSFFSYAPAMPFTVYLLEPSSTYTPSQPNYDIVLTGESGGLVVQIDDGINIQNPYTQQVDWTADPVEAQFWESALALNTNAGGGPAAGGGIVGLLDGVQSATAYLRIASYIGGQLGTISANLINIQAGIPGPVQPLPAGLTALSLQQALGMFVQIVGPAGMRQIYTSPGGHQIAVSAQDNGDGTARLDESEIN